MTKMSGSFKGLLVDNVRLTTQEIDKVGAGIEGLPYKRRDPYEI
jgi:hypothetical protein